MSRITVIPLSRLPLLMVLMTLPSCQTSSSLDGWEAREQAMDTAATSSYLAVAVREIMGPDEPILLLAEPGMCPGHFDLRPSQVRQLRACDILLRFDFQGSLDRRLGDRTDGSPRIVAVKVPGGMCQPASYLAACRQIGDTLVEQDRVSREIVERRLEAVGARLNELGEWMKRSIADANLTGTPVLASGHQEAFCKQLGLDVVAVFSGADAARPSEIDEAVRKGEEAGVKFVIANRPEGRQLADALAERLGGEVVVYANFPESVVEGAFDEMVVSNVRSLVQAAEK